MLYTELSCVIEGVSYVLPPLVVTSSQIEERLEPIYRRLKLPSGRLEMMTGIRERRFWEPGTRPSGAAAMAGKKALENAGVSSGEIGCIINASVCRDFLEPSTASIVHRELGMAGDAAIFDISNACLGVLNGIVTVANMIRAGQITAGMVVSGETAEGLHEATIARLLADETLTRDSFKKHFASLTIGSGAAAIVLTSPERAKSTHALLGGAVRTNSSAGELCQEDTDAPPSGHGPLMNTDSEALLHAGCELAGETWTDTCKALGWTSESPDHIFTHQIGAAHKRLLFETCGIDPKKDFSTVETLGNTGSAALPTAFGMGVEKKDIREGDLVALLGIGSGLTSLMLGVRW